MTEPTQEEIDAGRAFLNKKYGHAGQPKRNEIGGLLAEYAAELQAKIDRLEADIRSSKNLPSRVLDDLAFLQEEIIHRDNRIATLEAKLAAEQEAVVATVAAWWDKCNTLEAALAARDFVPIGDEHKDGGSRIVAVPAGDFGFRYEISRCSKCENSWRVNGERIYPTHAAPLPQPPKEGE